jgi:alpha-L-fucosidase
MQPAQVIQWIVDTVSKNGTFLLNVPGKPDGTIDAKERLILEHIGAWFKINGEAIYATRPWSVFGERPHMIKPGRSKASPLVSLTPVTFATRATRRARPYMNSAWLA